MRVVAPHWLRECSLVTVVGVASGVAGLAELYAVAARAPGNWLLLSLH